MKWTLDAKVVFYNSVLFIILLKSYGFLLLFPHSSVSLRHGLCTTSFSNTLYKLYFCLVTMVINATWILRWKCWILFSSKIILIVPVVYCREWRNLWTGGCWYLSIWTYAETPCSKRRGREERVQVSSTLNNWKRRLYKGSMIFYNSGRIYLFT